MLPMVFDFLKILYIILYYNIIFYLIKFFYLFKSYYFFFMFNKVFFFNKVFVMIFEKSIKTILNFYSILYVAFISENLINEFLKIMTINA